LCATPTTNVYVRSRRAGERVMELLRRLYGALRLPINEAKSAVARVWNRKFLGFSFWVAPGKTVRIRVADKALVAMKAAMGLHIALPNRLFEQMGLPRLGA
jgi:hypothetical protein